MNQEQDFNDFTVAMGRLALAFSHDLSTPQILLYFERLESCSMYQVSRAVNELIDTNEHFPYLSKILSLARSFKSQPSPPVSDNLQIEEVTAPAGTPRNKEDFFKNIYAQFD